MGAAADAPCGTPARIPPLRVTCYTAVSALGAGRHAHLRALLESRSGLRRNDFTDTPLETWIGRVDGLEQAALPAGFAEWDCRNNRLAWMALQADGFMAAVDKARLRHGADRVALVVGTSTSSIGASEEAYRRLTPDGMYPQDLRRPIVHTPHSLGDFLQHALQLEGPAVTVATACSSSAKAFAVAERWLRLDLADAVVVGGVDALCDSVLFGFNALGLIAAAPCRPFGAGRSGISVGEAAGFALLERGAGALQLLGYGESNDAHHMSSPHPQGLGAELALDDALARADLAASEIDYLNLHGTASARNDEVEAALVARRYDARVHASATKGVTGHTMGAAGMVEALVCLQALADGWLPGSVGAAPLDPALGQPFAARLQADTVQRPARRAASHSFGFGGNNCVLVFARGVQ
ncbi:MAG TPA: beta-ketoacyl-ACP synthase [Rubrivivax sp.]|nr:beta-ketoacyl-ACP synthase [Rubrivivax sp.]